MTQEYFLSHILFILACKKQIWQGKIYWFNCKIEISITNIFYTVLFMNFCIMSLKVTKLGQNMLT